MSATLAEKIELLRIAAGGGRLAVLAEQLLHEAMNPLKEAAAAAAEVTKLAPEVPTPEIEVQSLAHGQRPLRKARPKFVALPAGRRVWVIEGNGLYLCPVDSASENRFPNWTVLVREAGQFEDDAAARAALDTLCDRGFQPPPNTGAAAVWMRA